MSNKHYKGLLFHNEINDDFVETDDKQHTASTISLLSQQQLQQQHHHSNNKLKEHQTLTKQYATTLKSQKFPGKIKPLQQQGHVTNVKPYEKLKNQQHSNPHNQPATIAAANHKKSSNNNNDNNNLSSVRRIRKPTLWLGNFEKAKVKHEQKALALRNNRRNANTNPVTFNNDSVAIVNATDDDDATGTSDAAALDDFTQRKISYKSGLLVKVKSFIIEFLQDSSIHGFVYLAKIGLNFIERTLWLAFICVAIFSIISLSQRTWQRFQTSPMVISMDRNKLVWNTSFPSLTVCPHKRIDELKVEEYMLSHPNIFVEDEDKEGFKDFIEKLARLSYENIDQLPLNNSYGITSDKYLDLLYELKWQFEPEISSGAAVKMYIYETQTEFGICHSVNSLVARYNSYGYWRNNEWSILNHGERVTVHPLDGEIYAQIINLSTAYDVYFHSSADIPSITKQHYTFPETDYTTVELIALEISTDEAAKAFSTKQRKCRFKYESEDMLTSPVYSFGLCLAECRMFLALRVCSCVPHFYRNKLRNGRTLPICGLRGLACVAKLKSEMISLKSNRYKIDCNCLANCDDSNFFVQSYRSRVWFLGANLQWGIIDYPKMQLRRDVLFSFADVLVYIGGLVGFFLGCSALSFTELIYYFTIRFAKRILA